MAFVMASATAFAATHGYKGHLKHGGKVSLQVEFKHGKPVKVLRTPPPKSPSFRRVPVHCDGGKTTKIEYTLPELKVDASGRFRWRDNIPSIGASAKARGRFLDGGKKVKGMFFWELDFVSALFTNCDTGKVRWTAAR